jgi:tetratricopeptide (TPR) repeat protein
VELDPQNAYARCWLAIVHFFRHENDKFEAEAERALSLNPNDPETLADIGHFLAFMGAFERGIALSRKAQKLNPLHPGWYYFSFARYHYDQRDYATVLADVEKMGMPDFYWTHLLAAAALGQLGRTGASAALNEIYRLKPAFVASAEILKWNAAERDFAHLMAGLRKAGYSEPASD